MAKCKICKVEIPDGSEYCKDCLEKDSKKTNESYLDNLLNSVKNTAPAVEKVYKKTNEDNEEITKEPSEQTAENEFSEIDFSDIEDFDQYSFEDDLDNIISDEDLFGDDISKFLSEDTAYMEQNLNQKDDLADNHDLYGHDSSGASKSDELGTSTVSDEKMISQEGSLTKEREYNQYNSDYQTLNSNDEYVDPIPVSDHEKVFSQNIDRSDLTDNSSLKEGAIDIKDSVTNNVSTKEINEFIDDDADTDADLNDLLNRIDTFQAEENENSDTEEENPALSEENNLMEKSAKQQTITNQEESRPVEEDDFLSLLNQIDPDDPVAEDVKVINDLMNGKAPDADMDISVPSDVGEVFSDALKAVSGLNDPNIDESQILEKVPNKKDKKDKNAKKEKIEKKKKIKKSKDKGQEAEGKEDKPKVGFLKRLFGNVKDEKTRKLAEETGIAATDEKVAVKENSKKLKTKKKKGKKPEPANGDESLKDGKQSKDNSEKVSKKGKKDKKKDKKEKKVKSKDVIQVIDEIEEDEGRINRLGAVIVFIFFGLITLLFFVGTNAVSYTLSIQHATTYFHDNKYTKAYNEVYGMELKDEDIELYDKIQTVMFVNKQLNSYNNYCMIGEYPEALDSLLKGLKRYDKYIELATMLGIKTDMDYVRKQIIEELKSEFSLTEKQALNIIKIDNMSEYSLKVYNVASKIEK